MTTPNPLPQRPLNVLILEDQEADALLMVRELGKSDYQVQWTRVETEPDFLKALDEGTYDLVLSDYSMPAFNALRALKLFQERRLDMPFIVVTGSLGEEEAVKLIKEGASDYLIKDRLTRLGGAVTAALEQKRLRDEHGAAIRQVEDSEARFRRLAENAPDIIYRYRLVPESGFEYISPAFERQTGYRVSDVLDGTVALKELFYPEDLAKIQSQIISELYFSGPFIIRWIRKNGKILWTEVRNNALTDETGQVITLEGIARDITDQIQREREREVIISMATVLRDTLTRAEIYPAVLEKAADLLKADAAALVLFDADGLHGQVEKGYGFWSSWQGARIDVMPAVYQTLVEQGQSYSNSDMLNNPPGVPAAWVTGLQRVGCAPLKAQGEVFGMLCLGQRAESDGQEARENWLHLLSAVADIAASALHRARLFDETQQRLQHLTALRTIDRAITASLDLNLMINILVDQLMIQKGVDGVELLLLEPHTRQIRPAQGRGFRGRGLEDLPIRMGDSLTGSVILARRSLHIPDFDHYPSSAPQKALYVTEGFRAYLGVPLIAKGEVLGVLEILRREARPFEADWLEFVESLVGQVAVAINNAELFDKLQRSTYDIIHAFDSAIEGWSRALESRSVETRGHTNRVVWWTTNLARKLGMPDAELMHVRRGVLLHDIGKMALPDQLLLKPGPLTDEERALMRKHPVFAFEWLSPVIYLQPALDIPYCHHEAWDGSGYPRGLQGQQIPLAARIFSVVDVWDALRSDRPFRAAWPKEQALKYIEDMAGVQFDPQVVAAFLEMIRSEDGEDDF